MKCLACDFTRGAMGAENDRKKVNVLTDLGEADR